MDKAVTANDPNLFVDELLNALAAAEEVQVVDAKPLAKAKDFLTKCMAAVNSKIAEDKRKPIKVDAADCSEVFLEMEDLQLLEPRGRFQTKFHDDRVIFVGKQGSSAILGSNIAFMCLLPSTTSSKKEGEDILAILLVEPVTNPGGGKDTNKIVVNLSKAQGRLLTAKDGIAEIEAVAVPRAFRRLTKAELERPSARLFCSSVGQKPYVRCHKGTQEGAIYPLQGGIVFIKPLLFVGVDDIASITAGRGGGAGNTRYVDLKVETAEEKVHEFVNIDRDELPALQAYVRGYLEARIRRKAEEDVAMVSAQGHGGSALGVDEDDSDEEDDDYDPNRPESDSSDSSSDDDDEGADAKDSDNSSDDGKGSRPPSKPKAKPSAKPLAKKSVQSSKQEGKKAPVAMIKAESAAIKRTMKQEDAPRKASKSDFFVRAIKRAIDLDSGTASSADAEIVEIVEDKAEKVIDLL